MAALPDSSFLHRLADLADEQTLPRFRTALKVDTKPKDGVRFDPVTDADREAEVAMRAEIGRAYPDHAVLGEEFGESGSGPFRWVLDPVDGTRPFLCGIPVWGTLIGLTVNGRAELGLLSQPFTAERFWADTDGAWTQRAGQRTPLRSSGLTELAEAILHINAPVQSDAHLAMRFGRLGRSVKMTRYGGECYAFAMLAAGRIDLAFEPRLQPYDIVALIPIIERSGGVISRLDGGRAEAGGSILASATGELHTKALEILTQTSAGDAL